MSELSTEPQDYYVDIPFVPARTLGSNPEADPATIAAIGIALLHLTSHDIMNTQMNTAWSERSRLVALRGEF